MLVESLIKNTVELQGFRVLSVVMGEGGLLAKLGPDGRYLPRCGCCGEQAAYRDTRPVRRFRHVPLWGMAMTLAYAPRRIRENLDTGRPDQVQLIFNRGVTRRTPGRSRTRVITDGVTPSLHVDYKHCRIKQYHKEGQALRTETTINDTRDFAIGRRLHNLAALRQVGFTANRRLLDVQTISHDCALGEDDLQRHQRPVVVDGQPASALRFAVTRVLALMQVLLLFVLSARGFSNRDLREQLAPLLGLAPSQLRPGQMTCDLRRLRLHGLIEHIPDTHRYRLTAQGLKTAMFYTRVYNRILRPGLAVLNPRTPEQPTPLRRRFTAMNDAIDSWCDQAKLAA